MLLQALVAITFHSFGGQRDDRQAPERGIQADGLSGFVSVHFRHHDVHQYDRHIGLKESSIANWREAGAGNFLNHQPLLVGWVNCRTISVLTYSIDF